MFAYLAGEGEKLPRGERFHRVLAELPELEAAELWFGPGLLVEPTYACSTFTRR